MNELTFKIDSGVQKITVYEDAIKQTSDILNKNMFLPRNAYSYSSRPWKE